MADEPESFVDEPVEIHVNPPEEAEAKPEVQEGEESESSPEGDEEAPLRDEKGRFKGGVQARIDELTRARREAERERDHYKALAEPKTAQDPAKAASSKPTPDQFEDYGAYVEALTDWKVEQRETANASKSVETAEKRIQGAKEAEWAVKVDAAKADLPDFDEVVGKSEIQVAQHVVDALMEADKGPELLHHLAQHPEVVSRLNTMSPAKAAIEMGRLEATVGVKPAREPSKAPAPITPIRAGAGGKVNLESADMDTYIAERRKQGARF